MIPRPAVSAREAASPAAPGAGSRGPSRWLGWRPAAVGSLIVLAASQTPGVLAPALAQTSPLQISADQMSGSHGPEGDVVNLRGNVKIIRGRTVITSETGTYHRTEGLLDLVGKVRIVDSTTTITCDQASYSENDDVVQLSGNVVARDQDVELRSPSAVYDRRAGRADMYGGVRADHKRQRMTSDRAVYFRDSSVVHARGNVRGEDEENHSVITAREVDFDRNTNEAVARGDPALTSKDPNGEESVIRALLLRFNSETHVAEALDSVRVSRDTLQASADYGLFDDDAEVGWLLGHPRAWDNNTTVVGDTLQMLTHQRQLQRVIVRSHASMEYRGAVVGGSGDVSRLTGERVVVFFTDENIDSLVAVGGARNEYRGAPTPGKTAETNLALGDSIKVFFDERQIDRARVTGHASGEYHLAVSVGDTTAAAEEIVRYDATAIEFVVPKRKIVLDPNAHLTYKDVELTARHVEFDSERQVLVAEGRPELVEHGDKVTGHLMTYDLESRVGNIYKAETAYEKGLYHGQQIRKVNENELDVLGGDYSTCNLVDPHYHFSARWMKIYLKDKLVAKPVVFYVKNVPLLALPFWIFPIKPGRHSGFLFPQFELGFSNRAGRFLRNAGYYWAPNDFFDITLSGDYYQFEPSWVMRAEGYYKLQYILDGNFRTSFARNDRLETEDWDLDADHSQELTPRTRLAARASFVSSRDYNSSNLFGRPISQRLNRFLTSNLAVTHNADWASFNAAVDRRQDLDADNSLEDPDGEGPEHGPPIGTLAALPNLTQSTPSLSIGFPTRVVGSLPFLRGSPLEKRLSSMYFSLNARFLSFREQRAFVESVREFETEVDTDSINVLGQRITTRRGFATSSSLSDARRLFGWLNIRPGVTGDVAVFDFDELGHRIVPTGVWSSSLTGSTTFYGTFQPHIGPLTGLRHIVTPNVSFSYSPEFPYLTFVDSAGVRRPRFNNFGGIGVSGFRTERMNFSVDQRLQVRLGTGDKVRKLDNLVSMTMAGSYNFLYREQNQAHPLSPISVSMFIQPPTNLNGAASAIVDPYQGRPLRSLTYNTGIDLTGRTTKAPSTSAAPQLPTEGHDTYYNEDLDTFEDRWQLGLAYSYSGGYEGRDWSSNQTMNIVARYRMTPSWLVDYSTNFDITNRLFGIQQFSLSRDLHCWTAQFTRTFAPGGEAEYYFRLSVKDQRELFVERGTRTGSLGGIQ